MIRVVLLEPLLDRLGLVGVLDIAVAECIVRILRHGRHAFEVDPRRPVEPRRRVPVTHLGDGSCERSHGIVDSRHRAVPGRTAGDERGPARLLLGGLNLDHRDAAFLQGIRATLGETEFRLDLVPVILDHVVDADFRRAFLPGFGEEDDVAVEFDAVALEHDQQHQPGRDVVLVIERAPAIDPAVFAQSAERFLVPFFRLHADDIRMPHDQDRALGAVAIDPRDEICPIRVERIHLRVDALGGKRFFQVICRQRFIAGRIGRIDPDQVDEMVDRFFAHRIPVDQVFVLGDRSQRNGQKQNGEQPVHYFSPAESGCGRVYPKQAGSAPLASLSFWRRFLLLFGEGGLHD